jgi:hypothetical protein
MRPPIMLTQLQGANIDAERHRGEAERHAHHRSLAETQAERPSVSARAFAATLRYVQRNRHSLTEYPCRLPDGKIGRTAVVQRDGEWALVCRVA